MAHFILILLTFFQLYRRFSVQPSSMPISILQWARIGQLRYIITLMSALILLLFARYAWQSLERFSFSHLNIFIANSWWGDLFRVRRQCTWQLWCCHSLGRQVRDIALKLYICFSSWQIYLCSAVENVQIFFLTFPRNSRNFLTFLTFLKISQFSQFSLISQTFSIFSTFLNFLTFLIISPKPLEMFLFKKKDSHTIFLNK